MSNTVNLTPEQIKESRERKMIESRRKVDVVYVRYGFRQKVMALSEVLSDQKEICSCDSYVIRYEDKNGKECSVQGVYPEDYVDPNQIDMFND